VDLPGRFTYRATAYMAKMEGLNGDAERWSGRKNMVATAKALQRIPCGPDLSSQLGCVALTFQTLLFRSHSLIRTISGNSLTTMMPFGGVLNSSSGSFKDGFLFGLTELFLHYALLWQPVEYMR
jgi:hypothetical protein